MKNIIKRLLLAVIGIFLLLGVEGVNAEEVLISTLPKDYTSGEFNYTIEGFAIKIYDASNDSEGNSKYFTDKKVLYTIPITDDTLKINPENLESTMNNIPGTFIDLNLSIDKTKLESLVKSKITSMENGDSYVYELVVNYKLTKIPTNYSFMNHINIMDILFSAVEGNSRGIETINLNETTSQLLNYGSLTKNLGEEQFTIDEELSSNDSDKVKSSAAVLDFAYLSQTSDVEIISNKTPENTYIFMFHNLDNIEQVLQSYNDIYTDMSNKAEDISPSNDNEKQPQKVNVEDTGKTAYLGYITGLIILTLGIIVLIQTYITNKKLKNNN